MEEIDKRLGCAPFRWSLLSRFRGLGLRVWVLGRGTWDLRRVWNNGLLGPVGLGLGS